MNRVEEIEKCMNNYIENNPYMQQLGFVYSEDAILSCKNADILFNFRALDFNINGPTGFGKYYFSIFRGRYYGNFRLNDGNWELDDVEIKSTFKSVLFDLDDQELEKLVLIKKIFF